MSLSFGSIPGVKIDVEGGRLGGITLGTEETVVLFGLGDPTAGNANVNTPTQVTTGTEADNEFGEGTRLAESLRDAIANGANARGGFLFGVMPATTSISGEAISGGSGVLGNVPLVPDLSTISVENTTAGTDADNVEFRFDSPPTAPTTANEVHINPFSGELEAGDSDDYAVDYLSPDYQSAFDSAANVVSEGTAGLWAVDSASEEVAAQLYGSITPLRDPEFRMIRGLAAAEPNANSSETPPEPIYDAGSYSDNLNSFHGFATVPGVLDAEGYRTAVGAAVGLAAGNALDDPILTDGLSGITIETGANGEGIPSKSDRDAFDTANLLTLSLSDGVTVDRTPSTGEDTVFDSTFQSVRVIDRSILGIREVAKAFRGRLDVEGGPLDTEAIAAQTALGFLEDLRDDQLLQPNTDDEPNRLFVRPAGGGAGEIALEVGITPVFAVETFRTEITVSE